MKFQATYIQAIVESVEPLAYASARGVFLLKHLAGIMSTTSFFVGNSRLSSAVPLNLPTSFLGSSAIGVFLFCGVRRMVWHAILVLYPDSE